MGAAELDQQLRSIHILVNQSLAWEGAGFKATNIEELDNRIARTMLDYQKSLAQALSDRSLDTVERAQLEIMSAEVAEFPLTISVRLRKPLWADSPAVPLVSKSTA